MAKRDGGRNGFSLKEIYDRLYPTNRSLGKEEAGRGGGER